VWYVLEGLDVAQGAGFIREAKGWMTVQTMPTRAVVVSSLTRFAALALLAGGLQVAPSAAAVEPRPRPALARDRIGVGRGPQPAQRRDADSGLRGTRRDIEGASGVRRSDERTTSEPMLMLRWREGGCAIDAHRDFVNALLRIENPSDVMSLEVWGDAHEYRPYQQVFYYLRVPRPAYVTLFWIGPRHDIFVPFQNLRIPPDRDVSVDPDSVVVPPLGREQWVALASLEPIVLPCYASEVEHLRWLERLRRLPHGVGRWEVRSKGARVEGRTVQ